MICGNLGSALAFGTCPIICGVKFLDNLCTAENRLTRSAILQCIRDIIQDRPCELLGISQRVQTIISNVTLSRMLVSSMTCALQGRFALHNVTVPASSLLHWQTRVCQKTIHTVFGPLICTIIIKSCNTTIPSILIMHCTFQRRLEQIKTANISRLLGVCREPIMKLSVLFANNLQLLLRSPL